MEKTGIFYGPVGGSTEAVANKIAAMIGKEKCDLVLVAKADAALLDRYDRLIFGIATIGNETWHSEPVKSGWFTFWGELEKAELESKVIAIFGLGDSVRYADHFVDAMGELNRVIEEKGGETVGHVDSSDYSFRESKALVGDMFCGLPVDEDFEASLTEARIADWVASLKVPFGF